MALLDIRAFETEQVSNDAVRCDFLGAPFDLLSAEGVLQLVGESTASTPFRYVVTPNVDHVVRLRRQPDLMRCYSQAWLSVCDSRPIAALSRLLGRRLSVVTGSDLTVNLFRSVVRDGDLVSVIAADQSIVQALETRYPQVQFRSHVPPLGLAANTEAMTACVEFVTGANARFVFIAVGCPQSEWIAFALSRHPDAHGTGLCIGASLEFLIGAKKRAPVWMQHIGFEWLHRLATDPRRLWRRYAYAVWPLAMLFRKELFLRHEKSSPK